MQEGHNMSDTLEKRLSHVKVGFLPPNTASKIQPCDQGIICAFKAKYGTDLVRHCVRTIDVKGDLIMTDLKQAIYFIQNSWKNVSSETIINCWQHAGEII